MSWYIINGMRRLFRDAIPAGSETNSVYEILKTQLQPRLPTSGTLSTVGMTDIPLTVPSANDTVNVNERDVIGNKGDAAQTTVGTTRSLMGYIKGALTEIAKIPKSDSTVSWNATALGDINAQVDSALNTIVPASPTAGSMNDIMSKAAGGNTFSKATDSLEMLSDKLGGYAGTSGAGVTESVKAELDLINAKTVSSTAATATGVIVQDRADGLPNVVSVPTADGANTLGSWVLLDAATDAISWISHVTVSYTNASTQGIALVIGKGASGSETPIIRFSFTLTYVSDVGYRPTLIFPLPIPIKVAAGTRIAACASHSEGGSAVTLSVGLSMYQGLE